ncbi:MAG: hypothetical protein ACQKBY_10255 [Verrucomicrobiales bacterium]
MASSLAGVTGPCPSCGAVVTAPRAPEKEEAKREEAGSTGEIPRQRRATAPPHPGRSVNPGTGLSFDYEERKEAKAVLRMLFVGLLVVAVVAAVFFWMKYR